MPKSKSNSWYSITASAQPSDFVELSIVGDIGDFGVSAQTFLSELKDQAADKRLIKIWLHSLGGSLFDGLAIYHALKNHPAQVEITILGVAASMGSVIAMSGDIVRIPANGWMMLHLPSSHSSGNSNEIREMAELLDRFAASLIDAYAQKTGIDKDSLQQMLAIETWLDGQQAVESGFADELTEAVEAAANLDLNTFEEFKKMPKKAQELLQPKAAATAPNNPGSQEINPPHLSPGGESTTPQASGAEQEITGNNAAASFADFAKIEQGRRAEIKAIFKSFEGQADLLAECLDNMECGAEDAKSKLLTALGKSAAPAVGAFQSASHIHVSNGAIVADAMINALSARAGLDKIENKNPYKGMTLVEMARASLTEKGHSAYGMDRMEVVGQAFTHTSSDFGMVLSNVANKALLKGYDEAGETFQQWTSSGVLSDFKPAKKVGLHSFPTLDQVDESAEYSYATIGETGETISLATYGKMFALTRQLIINDDLGVFVDILQKMGRAALRTVGDLVYAVLLGQVKMSDGKTLFHNDHGNLMEGAAISAAAWDKAGLMMALQTDVSGTTLNIEPQYFIGPRAMKAQATTLANSAYDPEGKHAHVLNTAQGFATVVTDARIDHWAKKNNKPLPWFLAAGQAFDTIQVSWLDGNDKPYLEQRQGWSVDGTEFKVRLDAGVNPLSYRTLLKNPGV